MDTANLIKELRSSGLIATCPCGEEFKLSEALLFDGLGKFPELAEEARKALLDAYTERLELLKKRKISASAGAEQKAIEVGIGKIVEKIVPTYSSFGIPTSDCRPLFEPIDLIAFNGLTAGKLSGITFMEIKTGGSRLNNHQKMVKEAVAEKKVCFKEVG